MGKYTTYKGSPSDKPPTIAKPENPPAPMILTVQEGIPIQFPPCEGAVVHVLHPTNPNGPSQNFGITMLYMPPHAVLPPASGESEECYFILDGQGLMTSGHETRQVKKGDFVYLRPWCPHGIENTGTEMLIVVVTMSPPLS